MNLPFFNNNIVVVSTKEHLNEGLVRNGPDFGDRPNCFFHDTILKRNGLFYFNKHCFTISYIRHTLSKTLSIFRSILFNRVQ